MKRRGLSWDGGKRRVVAVAMMLSVMATPGVAHAATQDSGSSQDSVVSVEMSTSLVKVRLPTIFGVSWG